MKNELTFESNGKRFVARKGSIDVYDIKWSKKECSLHKVLTDRVPTTKDKKEIIAYYEQFSKTAFNGVQ